MITMQNVQKKYRDFEFDISMEIPDGSLAFGNPAKVRRMLSEEEIASNRNNALLYVKEAKDQLLQM